MIHVNPSSERLHQLYGPTIAYMVGQKLSRFPGEHDLEAVQEIWVDVLADHQEGVAIDLHRVSTLVERHVKRRKRCTLRGARLAALERPLLMTISGGEAVETERELESPDPWGRPDRSYDIRWTAAYAHRLARRSLSETQYKILQLRIGAADGVDGVAHRLELTSHSVKNELRRGLRRLALALQRDPPEGLDERGRLASLDALMLRLSPLTADPRGGCPAAT